MTCVPSEDIHPIWSKSSLCTQWIAKVFACEQRRLWSDWADAQADLSLPWAHTSFCLFCHAAAHISSWVIQTYTWKGWNWKRSWRKKRRSHRIKPSLSRIYRRWSSYRVQGMGATPRRQQGKGDERPGAQERLLGVLTQVSWKYKNNGAVSRRQVSWPR